MPRIVALLALLAWLAGSLAWVGADRMVRDGDEEGHVGAAELFRDKLRAGEFAAFADDAWRGDLGEYPPLFPAAVGAWWWATGVGQPGRLPVRAFCLGSVLLAAIAAGGAARVRSPDPPLAGTTAFVAVLLLPLANGLGRHFMPEGALVAAVALATWAAARAGAAPTIPRALALGLALGAGLLVKQTFALAALVPVALLAAPLRARAFLSLAAAAAVAGPWYLRHLPDQLAYGARSAEANADMGLLAQAGFYPAVAGWVGLGPVLALATLGALAVLVRRPREALPGLAWLLGGMVLMALVPKKYPRLLAPLTPGAALLAAAAIVRVRRPAWHLAGWGLAAALWLGFASLYEVAPPDLVRRVTTRCVQVWLGPPRSDDLGLGAIADSVRRAPPGPVAVRGAPSIPCAVETTHDWVHHLGPYLRREGLEREIVEFEEEPPARAALVIDWEAHGGEEVPVPALGCAFRIRSR